MEDLANAVAVITGAGSGIGWALALALHRADAHPALCEWRIGDSEPQQRAQHMRKNSGWHGSANKVQWFELPPGHNSRQKVAHSERHPMVKLDARTVCVKRERLRGEMEAVYSAHTESTQPSERLRIVKGESP